MRKQLLDAFEDLELFSENLETALEKALERSEYPLDLRLHKGFADSEIYDTEASIANYNEMLADATNAMITNYQDETFIDIYENTPAEAVFTGVTIWLTYDERTGRVSSRFTC